MLGALGLLVLFSMAHYYLGREHTDAVAASTSRLDPQYGPTFRDAFVYAQLLYEAKQYEAAGPVYEIALSRLSPEAVAGGAFRNEKTARRVLTDQAGMSYGLSGNLDRAKQIYEQAINADPDYPNYYYNLACADAEAGKLADARQHLEEAFARKQNVIEGERLPDPSTDDSFTRYRNNKEFWSFVTDLATKQ